MENCVTIIAVEVAGTFLGDGEGQRLMLVPSDIWLVGNLEAPINYTAWE